jgi:hypothetical protein
MLEGRVNPGNVLREQLVLADIKAESVAHLSFNLLTSPVQMWLSHLARPMKRTWRSWSIFMENTGDHALRL